MVENEFPDGFEIQRIRTSAAMAVAEHVPAAIAAYFREHPAVANDLLKESYDKRYSHRRSLQKRAAGSALDGTRRAMYLFGISPIWPMPRQTSFYSPSARALGLKVQLTDCEMACATGVLACFRG